MLATSCMIYMMITSRIDTRYFLLKIVVNVNGYRRYQSRGMKRCGRKIQAKGLVCLGIDLNPEVVQ